MIKKQHLMLVFLFLVGACNDRPTREESIVEFKQSTQSMSCDQLNAEWAYQTQIKNGIIERQNKQITVDDFIATAATAGVNVAMNQSGKLDRNERLTEIEQKMAIVKTKMDMDCSNG